MEGDVTFLRDRLVGLELTGLSRELFEPVHRCRGSRIHCLATLRDRR